MPLEPKVSWFSLKCVETQHLIELFKGKTLFWCNYDNNTKSRQTLNTRYDFRIMRDKGQLVRWWG